MSNIYELYIKEREYQKQIFGSDNPDLNIATFILLLEKYVQRARDAYLGEWVSGEKYPSWIQCINLTQERSSCPAKAFEEIIKLFALSGAAIEEFISFNHEEWRKDGIKSKWRDNGVGTS